MEMPPIFRFGTLTGRWLPSFSYFTLLAPKVPFNFWFSRWDLSVYWDGVVMSGCGCSWETYCGSMSACLKCELEFKNFYTF
jgi:hypothetical protein